MYIEHHVKCQVILIQYDRRFHGNQNNIILNNCLTFHVEPL